MSVLRFDPFRDLDRWAAEMMGAVRTPRLMPMDAYRLGDKYVVHLDCPGIAEDSLEVLAEQNTLTVKAKRANPAPDGAEFIVSERSSGSFTRQIMLGDGLDLEDIRADYRDGVLTVTIPIADQAKPRRIVVERGLGEHEGHKMISGTSRETEHVAEPAAVGAMS